MKSFRVNAPRRHLAARLASLAALALPMWAALPAPAAAQGAYPAKTISLVIPYAPGGPADTLARKLAQLLEQRLKATVIVESKAGGAAAVGTGFVARAKPDGYTLLLSTSAGHVVTPLMQHVGYDGVADFRFVAIVAVQPNVLVVHPSLGVDSLPQLLDRARQAPGTLNFASAGTGGATHLGAEALWQKAGVQVTHVPYGGAAPALKDLLGGQVKIAMLNLAATQPHIAKGTIRALAYSGARRAAALPDVPTLAEAGFAGTEVSTWYSLAAPRGTPDDVIAALADAMKAANADPTFQAFLASQGAEPMSLTPAETTAFVERDKAAMTSLLGSLNLLGK